MTFFCIGSFVLSLPAPAPGGREGGERVRVGRCLHTGQISSLKRSDEARPLFFERGADRGQRFRCRGRNDEAWGGKGNSAV